MHRAIEVAGITRLADVTGLDRIGLPCWQAVRPMSRSLSVHQGKGLRDDDAMLGAVLEGLEAYCGEQFAAPVMRCRYSELAERLKPPSLAHFAKGSAFPIDHEQELDWVIAERWDGGVLAVPFASVSMDFTRMNATPFDRSSNGIAVGTTREEAVMAALLELVERDAVAEWQSLSMIDRMSDQLDLDGVGLAWFDFWRERVERAGAHLRCYRVASFTGIPVMVSEIGDTGKCAEPFRAINGHAAHPDPEVALFRAIGEAIQGRAAYIAGSRDDLLPSQFSAVSATVRVAFAMPLPSGMDGVDFASVAAGPNRIDAIVDAIEDEGLGPVAVVDLGQVAAFHVVRVIACGLGARMRRRAA